MFLRLVQTRLRSHLIPHWQSAKLFSHSGPQFHFSGDKNGTDTPWESWHAVTVTLNLQDPDLGYRQMKGPPDSYLGQCTGPLSSLLVLDMSFIRGRLLYSSVTGEQQSHCDPLWRVVRRNPPEGRLGEGKETQSPVWGKVGWGGGGDGAAADIFTDFPPHMFIEDIEGVQSRARPRL